MSELSLKSELRALAEQAVPEVAESDLETERVALESFRYARADYDPERDKITTELPTFERTLTALGSLPLVRERYGNDKHVWRRFALQFVYGFLAGLTEKRFDSEVFEATWQAFWKELWEPEWTWLGLANVQNFRSESMVLDLGDGIAIRGRSVAELTEMGWSEGNLERLNREWFEGDVNSSHVILTEQKLPKTPDNFILTDTVAVYRKARRALLALRFFKEGDIAMGRMWLPAGITSILALAAVLLRCRFSRQLH